MINIQKSHLVHIGSIRSILFGPFWSCSVLFSQFYPLTFYLVQFGPLGFIQSTSVIFGPFSPHWLYSIQFVHFGPLQFCSGHSVHFGHIQYPFGFKLIWCLRFVFCIFLSLSFFFWFSLQLLTSSRVPQITLFSNFFIKNGSHSIIYTFKNYFATVFSVSVLAKISYIQTDPQSILVLFGPIQPTLVRFGPCWSILSISVQLGPFRSILSTLVLFDSPFFYLVHSVHFVSFGPIRSIGLLWSTSIYFCAIT